jgi:CDGSH-type Zn-finger protein
MVSRRGRGDAGRMTARLIPLPDGPYAVTGPLELERPDGEPIQAPPEIYLCRCGRSANKPFCDGSHARTGWSEDCG